MKRMIRRTGRLLTGVGLALLCSGMLLSELRAQQGTVNCAQEHAPYYTAAAGRPLPGQSVAQNAFCDELDRYIPGHLRNDLHHVLKVEVTVIVCADPAGNYMLSSPGGPVIDQPLMSYWYTNFVNPKFRNVEPIYVTNPSPTTEVSDSKIEFVVKDLKYFQFPAGFSLTTGTVSTLYSMIESAFSINSDLVHIIAPAADNGGWGMGIRKTESSPNKFPYFISTSGLAVGSYVPYLHERQLTHEIGHAFGLWHTFCTGSYCNGDGLNDTPDEIIGCDYALDPNCPMNFMGYNPGYYMSPRQVAIMRMNIENNRVYDSFSGMVEQGRSTNVLANCIKNTGLGAYQITTDQTWDKAVVMEQDILVKTGKTLTIQCKVSMPRTGKITVEPGARLIIDGGWVTNSCDALWNGIEVQGISTATQAAVSGGYQQGYLEIKNNGIVENATVGVTCNNGGILMATSALFRNNVRAVYFNIYQNRNVSGTIISNISTFTDCYFVTNKVLNENQDFDAFVYAVGVWLSRFRGNIFENSRAGLTGSSAQLGTGIYSYASKLALTSYCTSMLFPCPSGDLLYNEFHNLHIGVRISDVDPGNISGNKFYNCAYGVLSESSYDLSITGNQIWVGACPTPAVHPEYGIMLSGDAYGVTVRDNLIYESASPDAEYTMGIVGKSTGANSNTVHRNTLTNLDYGCVGLNINRNSSNSNVGLLFTCNTFSNTGEDIYVSYDAGGHYSSAAIRYYQGSATSSAGNVFTNDGVGTETDYHNLTYNNLYYYWDTGVKKKPLYYTSGRVILSPTGATAVNCNPDGRTEQMLRDDYDKASAQLLNLRLLEQEWFLDKSARKPDADEFRAAFEARNLFIPTGMQENIGDKTTPAELQSILSQLIADAELEQYRAVSSALELQHSGDMAPDNKELEEWLGRRGHPYTGMNKAVKLLEAGRGEEGIGVLNAIPSLYALSPEQETELVSFSAFYARINSWLKEGKDLADLPETDLDWLRTQAEGAYDRAGIWARNLLNLYYGGHYTPVVELMAKTAPGQTETPAPVQSQVSRLNVYPNPATNEVTLSWNAQDLSGEYTFRMVNALGQVVLQQQGSAGQQATFDLSSLKTGVYVCGFTIAGHNETFRLMVSR